MIDNRQLAEIMLKKAEGTVISLLYAYIKSTDDNDMHYFGYNPLQFVKAPNSTAYMGSYNFDYKDLFYISTLGKLSECNREDKYIHIFTHRVQADWTDPPLTVIDYEQSYVKTMSDKVVINALADILSNNPKEQILAYFEPDTLTEILGSLDSNA